MTGSVADVRAGVQTAAEEARRRGLLVSEIVIPRPDRELFTDYLSWSVASNLRSN